MRCWRGRLGLQAWRGMTWAAAVSKAKRKQTLRGGERSMCSFQGRVPTIRGGRTSEQQQGPWGSAKHVVALQTISSPVLNCRLFSSNAGNGDESEGQDDPPVFVPPVFQRVSSQLPGNRRRRAWEKSLSPLERVSRLVPEEFLSEEISAMRNSEIKESKQEPPAGEQDSSLFSRSIPQAQSHLNQGLAPEHLLNSASKNIPLQVGELILAEFQRRYSDIKKLFRLTAGGMLNGSWGTIHFVEIVGKLPGQLFLTSIGRIVLIRRPTLEEYVLLMRRGPTISYPKDMAAMLLLMDLNQGDKVLEVGSGSGALSLFLSRAVGPLGNVMSYEVRKDHHSIAKTNYQNWCAAWKLAHVVEWPDNVEFINEDIATAAEDLKMETFDAIALDMVTPQKALPVIPSLKQGGVCAVYVAKSYPHQQVNSFL
ncbi:tRNA (adenine(58)-N(1))-methyltransferase, mitochondrial isoform X2 [Sphaerodactylus townsendi]|uniref:tRNA (adenine(58)-N(1))-methyltransferase, mitochondrial isoform X2 n=1 Tax=Sphaerodactylus townsendi TaxID=933632 RepID=UPI0020268D74|nr:tRNA (adenine(58)-N(1))-methyltransferase, mitochondrial isoform X2 [Sphaerodactylus townsendi]